MTISFINHPDWFLPSCSLQPTFIEAGQSYPGNSSRFSPFLPHEKPVSTSVLLPRNSDKLHSQPILLFFEEPTAQTAMSIAEGTENWPQRVIPAVKVPNKPDFRKAALYFQPNGTWHRLPPSPCLKVLGRIILWRWSTISSLQLAKSGWVTKALGTALMDGTSRKSGKYAFKV